MHEEVKLAHFAAPASPDARGCTRAYACDQAAAELVPGARWRAHTASGFLGATAPAAAAEKRPGLAAGQAEVTSQLRGEDALVRGLKYCHSRRYATLTCTFAYHL